MDSMENYRTLTGDVNSSDVKIAIVASRYNEKIVGRLLSGCLDCLKGRGVATDSILIARAPGAFELPASGQRTPRQVRIQRQGDTQPVNAREGHVDSQIARYAGFA